MADIQRIRLADRLPEPVSHYTDAVLADGWLWISGMLAFDPAGELVGGDDVVKQAEQVHRNLEAVLLSAGAGFEHVVKVGVYLRRIADRAAVNTVRKRFFGDSRPASTLVEVSAFVVPGALVEIDAVAHVPTNSSEAGERLP